MYWRITNWAISVTLTWDQALFSFRFENNGGQGEMKIENVWEPLKLGLISGYFNSHPLVLRASEFYPFKDLNFYYPKENRESKF